jgi:hypothetical protein
MARVFTITAPSSTITLDAQGRGEIAFTVANASGRALRGRVSVVPQGSAQIAWLKLAGESERDFPVGNVQQFTVQVAVPAGAMEGNYAFRLDAFSVQNPDEDYTQGATVAFAVAKREPSRPFPWWIVAVAACVLVIGGGLLWWVLSSKKVAVPDVTKQSLDQAIGTLTSQQLKVGQITDETGAVATSGTVVSQSPAAGTQVSVNSTVNLVVKKSGAGTNPTILAVGVDHQLYTRLKIRSPWVAVPNSGSVIGVTQLNDGTFLGVGTDNLLYTRATLTSPWQQVPGSGSVIRAIQMSNGTIVGVGTDHRVYTRATLTSTWQPIVPDTGGRIFDIAQLSDGTFLGIGLGNDLWTLATLTGSWVNIPSSGAVIAIAVLQDGTILGVGTNNQLYTRSTTISSWIQVPNSGTVIAVAAMK